MNKDINRLKVVLAEKENAPKMVGRKRLGKDPECFRNGVPNI